MRYDLPQPFDELDHTADVGVVVRGESERETMARLALAMSHLLTGGGPVAVRDEPVEVSVEAGDSVSMAVDLLRELLFRFDCDHEVVGACEVLRFDPAEGAALAVWLAPWDEDAHEEGTELKAVTLHEARFERVEDGWLAQVVFDV
ncbi:MAG TPA: archease [Polyangiaceae bacterium]|nr:archease [Polyangiaceae bacterium]